MNKTGDGRVGFVQQSTRELRELSAKIRPPEHEKSGARLVYLDAVLHLERRCREISFCIALYEISLKCQLRGD